jgi:hypothetical protein
MVSANCLVLATPIPRLSVHFYRYCSTCVDGAFPRYAPSACIAAYVVGVDVCDGRVGRWEANARPSFIDAVDPELLEDGVGGD